MTHFTALAADFGVEIRAVSGFIGSSSFLCARFGSWHNVSFTLKYYCEKAISLQR
jgi:hypothetical protein